MLVVRVGRSWPLLVLAVVVIVVVAAEVVVVVVVCSACLCFLSLTIQNLHRGFSIQ